MNKKLHFILVSLAIIGLLKMAAEYWVMAGYLPQIQFQAALWKSPTACSGKPSYRQQMIRDLIANVLPNKNRVEIESLLGRSSTYEEMRRHAPEDFSVRKKDDKGNWLPFPRTGKGHYFEEYEWDLIYPIGKEHVLIFDHNGQEFSSDTEYLLIRLNALDNFKSWYIVGSTRWSKILPQEAFDRFNSNSMR